jgi:hypothetical protein
MQDTVGMKMEQCQLHSGKIILSYAPVDSVDQQHPQKLKPATPQSNC